jgi:uncharacterized protein YbaP (TraB family)
VKQDLIAMWFINPVKRTVFLAACLAVFYVPLCQAEQQGLLYSLSMNGEQRGYLLGTVHSDDPRVLNFSSEFNEALNSCDRFAMELVPNQPTLSRLMDYMHYQDGTTLEDRIGPERFRKVVEAAGSYGLGPDQLATMKVWGAMMTLSIPPPRNGLFMDLSLALQAAGNGKTVIGLETLDEQLSFLEDMPEKQQLLLLDQALEDFDSLYVFYEELMEAYLQSDLETLQTQSQGQFDELPNEVAEYFYEKGIDERNLRMRDRLVEALQTSTVFAAVGALHLPGEKGLVTLLRESGYTVSPVTFSPFAEAP